MAALRSRLSLNLGNNINNCARRSFASGAKNGKSLLMPATIMGATTVIGGSLLYQYVKENSSISVLPAVQASAPATSNIKTMERTFIMVKPDGVKRGLIADIIKRFEQRGYKLVAMKMLQPSSSLLNEHYADLKGRSFFPGLIKHISSGPVVAMVWEGKDVVRQGRQMLGETDPLKSKPGSIRGDYSIDLGRNIIHGSDSVDTANAEIKLWFSDKELMTYVLPLQDQVFE